MKKYINRLMLLVAAICCSPLMALADDGAASADWQSVSAAIVMALAAVAGTTAQGKAVATALEYIGRNPEAKGPIFIPLVVGLAMIESLVVLGFVIANTILK